MTPVRRHVLAFALLAPAALLGCMTGRVDAPPRSILFFSSMSTVIDAAGQEVVTQVTEDAKAHPRTPVYIAGFADASIAGTATASLSQARAQAVADALVARGVPRAQLNIRPRGATGADPGIESRRVDITFGG